MKKIICLFFTLLISISMLGIVNINTASAGDSAPLTGLKNLGTKAGYSQSKGLSETVGTIVNSVLGLLGLVFVILLIYGGFLWMIARGEEQKVTKAKNLIFNAIIGLVIVLAAYSIARFVLGALVKTT